eukprot:CAMPEP_0119012762 /NCGR_PEP_ID=MMETSP1176-20130426/7492_1 /TAXON_ID=265551 /ORGANISM="Synedropsis recta cf, Strain CCMP1620" /LENGTH=488 /DNA_ID=CAMNT_0006965785 /DNA_START=36 /DNA_END=1502 /DNA_ORIENTATION=-
MAPQTDFNELPYGDSRDAKNYHEDDAAFDERHKRVIDGTINLCPKITTAFMERAVSLGEVVSEEQPALKKTKLANGEALGKTKQQSESVIFMTPGSEKGSSTPTSIIMIDEVGFEDDNMMQIEKEGAVRYVPSPEMTGVKPTTTRLCAAISGQIYNATNVDDFNLNSDDLQIDAEIIMFEQHKKLEATTPPFVVVVTGQTMICGWRGSSTLMDWVMDFAFAPVASSRWIKSAKSIRVQGGYCSLVESDLSLHEDAIIEEIKKRGIQELILTGHSLAGGVAQVAHLCIEGSRANAYSPWSASDLKHLVVRSVAFSAPMTTVNIDRANDAESVAFVNHVGTNMCNVIYESDPVPRGYAHVTFIQEVLENAIPQVVKGVRVPGIFKRMLRVQGRVQKAVGKAIEGNTDVIKIAEYYRHIGKVIYYEDDKSKPVTYIDKGFHYSKPKDSTQKLFYDIKYKKSDDVFTSAKSNHMFLVAGPGLAYGIKQQDAK